MLLNSQSTKVSASATAAIMAASLTGRERIASQSNMNPLISALRTLPISESELRAVVRCVENSSAPLSETPTLVARSLAALPNKKSTTMAAILNALQQWAETQLHKDDLVVLHHGIAPTAISGTIANMGITIVCNSRSRQTRIEHATQLLLAGILGYFRLPFFLRIASENEISQRFFNNATVLIHGSEQHFTDLQHKVKKDA